MRIYNKGIFQSEGKHIKRPETQNIRPKTEDKNQESRAKTRQKTLDLGQIKGITNYGLRFTNLKIVD